MKKIALSFVALALTAGSALAADLPTRKGPPVLPPPPPPPPLWTGFYVGLNAGGGWASSTNTTIGTWGGGFNPAQVNAPIFSANYAVLSTGTVNNSGNGGFIGGGQVGYNYQFNNSFVAGIEADIQGIAGSSGAVNRAAALVDQFGNTITSGVSTSRNLDYIGTVRGRLGWLVTPTLLIYGTGGLAYGGVSSTTSLAQSISNPALLAAVGAGSFSDTRVGWTAGGGLEWMFWPNWSAKVEYLYFDLGSVTYNLSPIAPVLTPGFAGAGTAIFSNVTQVSSRYNGNIVRVGLNYHFNWGAPAPVVAKY